MTVTFNELYNSRSADGSSLKIIYLATGDTSTWNIRDAYLLDGTNFPEVNGPFYRNDEKLSIEQIDGLTAHFKVTAVWEAPTRKKENEKRQARENGDSHWEISTTSQVVRVANAKASQLKTAEADPFADTDDTAIGYSSATNEVEGTDRLASVTEFRLSFYKPANLVTATFRETVENLVNCTNDDEFLEYGIGELLLTEARFSSDAENFTNIRCDYTFLVERQRTETLEVLGDVTIPPHYYLDIQWEPYEDPGPPIRDRRRPKTVKRHRLYDGGTFAPLIATS